MAQTFAECIIPEIMVVSYNFEVSRASLTDFTLT